MDVSRMVKRLDAEHAYVIYRHGDKEIPATKKKSWMQKKMESSFYFNIIF